MGILGFVGDVIGFSAHLVKECVADGVKEALFSSNEEMVHDVRDPMEGPIYNKADYRNLLGRCLVRLVERRTGDGYLEYVVQGCGGLAQMKGAAASGHAGVFVRSAVVLRVEPDEWGNNCIRKSVWKVTVGSGHVVKMKVITPSGEQNGDRGMLQVGYWV